MEQHFIYTLNLNKKILNKKYLIIIFNISIVFIKNIYKLIQTVNYEKIQLFSYT